MLFILSYVFFFFFKQKTAYEMRISDWSSDVCSSDLRGWRPEATREAAREMALAQPLVALADALLAKRHRQALKRGRGFAKLPTAERHQLRIAVKKLSYTTEFFRGLYPPTRTNGYLAPQRALQDTPEPLHRTEERGGGNRSARVGK